MPQKLNDITNHLQRHYDAFIASASFEERSLSITKQIINKISFNHKFVSIVYTDKDIIGDRYNTFIDQYGFLSIEVNSMDQIKTVDNIITKINQILETNINASFLIDISTFRRQTLLILLRLLRNTLGKNNKVQFIYTPAKEYSIGLSESEKWLTKGILEVASVFGYSGIIRPSRPYHLILLMGYEVERASSLINEYEPSKITIGYASKGGSTTEEFYELNKKKFDELLSEFPNAESFEFSCVDIKECKDNVLLQAKKHVDYNVVISPMNNKISTISCGLAAFENDEIQLAIAIPAIYNSENYSTPSDSFYLLDIPQFIKN